MGQTNIKENIFRDGIIQGLKEDGIIFNKNRPYPNGENFGLIIKPLYLDMKFKLPIMLYFKGLPYHVGIIYSNQELTEVFSFCPNSMEPHKGNLIKDIKRENVCSWINSEDCEIFWILNRCSDGKVASVILTEDRDCFPDNYDKMYARLTDLMKITTDGVTIEEFNRRHKTTLGFEYNLFANNCTDVALSILIGKTKCYQVNHIKPILIKLMQCEEIINMLPDFGKKWIQNYKIKIGMS